MNEIQVARIYLRETKGFKELVDFLHKEAKVRGVTVFRGIMGYGESGEIHQSNLLDLSLDLPIVIEFFDDPDKVKHVINQIHEKLTPHHVISWKAACD